jgi:hypothetical protein
MPSIVKVKISSISANRAKGSTLEEKNAIEFRFRFLDTAAPKTDLFLALVFFADCVLRHATLQTNHSTILKAETRPRGRLDTRLGLRQCTVEGAWKAKQWETDVLTMPAIREDPIVIAHLTIDRCGIDAEAIKAVVRRCGRL